MEKCPTCQSRISTMQNATSTAIEDTAQKCHSVGTLQKSFWRKRNPQTQQAKNQTRKERHCVSDANVGSSATKKKIPSCVNKFFVCSLSAGRSDLQSLRQIRNDIICLFNAHTHTNQIIRYTKLFPLFLRHGSMRHHGG